MSLEQHAYLAEIVAAMAVVPSLIYLAVQVRQSNAQTRAAARFAFVEATGDINAVIAQDKSVASLWRRGLRSPEDLDEDEIIQLWMLIGQYANTWMVMHHLHQDGNLPENQWSVVRNDMLGILTSEGGRAFWKIGAEAFDPAFRRYVNSLLESGERSYDMLAR
jgi:hypothetical protein